VTRAQAEIAVIGGSGFYEFLDDPAEILVHTPYGAPSAPVTTGTVGDRRVAFLPRHGVHHEFPPHRVNYRANLWALRELGVTRVFGPCAAGSLQPGIHPGDFVILDQLVDRTWGRPDTYVDGPVVGHVSFADPYCPDLGAVVRAQAEALGGLQVHHGGTAVVIQGPRFSTRAESAWYRSAGWEIINMTQYPEAYLCRELGMAVVNISLITDFDAGVLEGTEAVNAMSVLEVFELNAARIRKVVLDMIGAFPADLAGLGAAEALRYTRGDGHAASDEDIRLFETRL
jgi:5'-methylthioadenosine phosphorylase